MWWTLILALTTFPPTQVPPLCSVGALRDNPEGYHYRFEQVRGFVVQADIIVRASPVAADSVREALPDVSSQTERSISFRIIEVLHGSVRNKHLVFPGFLVERDDYNAGEVPYRMVRSSGQRGDCFAREYRLGAEYLLLIQRQATGFTIQWAPLAPLNEQIRGPNDPWVVWVRNQIPRTGAPRRRT